MSRPLFLAALLTSAVFAGCSASSSPRRPGAAEPATAPPTTSSPAGTTARVGAQPEGIVYDATTDLVAVAVRAPDRLQLLDPTTLAVVRSVALPGSARHLQLAGPGGPVLVPDETAKQLVQVSLPNGAKVETPVGEQPHDAAAVSGGQIVVGNEFGRSASVIRDARVRATIGGLQQPGGVIGDGATFAVVDVHAFTVSTYDSSSLHRLAIAAAGAGPTHGVLIGGNRILVADTRGNEALVFGIDPLRKLATLPLPGTPYGLATDRTTGTVWVTLTARNQVVGLDVSGRVPRVIARYATVRQPNTVAVAPGSRTLWVTGTEAGVVQRISR